MATQAPQNTLLQCLKEVVEGRAGNDRLADTVATVRREIESDRDGFNQTVEAMEPTLREAVAGYVEQAHDMLNAYDHALDILEESIKTGSRRKLLQGAEQVGRCLFQCSFAFKCFRDAVLIAQGPTDIPNLNQMLQAYDELVGGQGPEMKLMVVAERERRMAAHELRKLAEKPSELAEVADVQRAWKAHHDVMVALLEAIEKVDRTGLGVQVDRARDTFAGLKTAIPAAEEAILSQGPSPSAIVNMLINTTRDMINGKVSSEVFTTVLASLRQNVKESEAKFEVVTSAGVEPEDLQAAVQRAKEAFAEYETGFSRVGVYQDNYDVRYLNGAMVAFESASKKLHEAQQKVLDHMEREGKTACVKCGHFNAQGRVRCERCGTGLPLLSAPSTVFEASATDAEEGFEEPIVSDTLRKVYEAVNGVAEGSLTSAQFLEVIEWFETVVDTQAAGVGPLKAGTTEGGEEVTEAMAEAAQQLFNSSVEHFRLAIEQLKAYAQDGNKLKLAEGVRLCNHAAHELKRIEAVNTSAGTPTSASSEESMVG